MGEITLGERIGKGSVTVIAAHNGWRDPRMGGPWAYRELLQFLVWRALNVRHRRTFFGAAGSLPEASDSLDGGEETVTKVRSARLLLPFAVVASFLREYGMTLGIEPTVADII